MTRLSRSRSLRWALPAVVAAAVAAAAITTTNGAGASEQPVLPARSAAQLLASVEQAHPTSLTGTIVETARLGLPSLPTSGDSSGGDSLSFQSLLTGSHTMKIWYAGPTKQRLAILAPMSERDVIHNGADLWTYTSTTNEVTHSTLSPHAREQSPETLSLTPQQAAVAALQAIDPTTAVTVDKTARVAGRAAYQLDLAPRDVRSLIGSVRIAIDAATSVPLRVEVFARGASTPAIDVGFTDISYGAISPAVFDFTVPAGATVTHGGEQSQTRPPVAHPPTAASTGGTRATAPGGVHRTLGHGWTAVQELSVGPMTQRAAGSMLYHLSKAVPGGRLITTSLVSALITSNGHLFIGAVTGPALEHVAETGRGL